MSLHCVVCLLWAWLSSLFSWVAAHTVQFPKREVWESPLVSWGGGLALGSQSVCLSLGTREAGKTGRLTWELSGKRRSRERGELEGRPFFLPRAWRHHREVDGILWGGLFSPGKPLEMTGFLASHCSARLLGALLLTL